MCTFFKGGRKQQAGQFFKRKILYIFNGEIIDG